LILVFSCPGELIGTWLAFLALPAD
jgi:hypothetical protein